MPCRPLPLILDVDTGVDDALALLFALRHPSLDLRAVTCVAGNVELDQVVRNTLGVLSLGSAEVPVGAGADRPLLEPHRSAAHVHGADGLGGLSGSLPHPPRRARHDALEVVAEAVEASADPVTLVSLGPMTNVAGLVQRRPDIAGRLGALVVMGGAIASGNATPVAEFNVWHDPEAAALAFGAGIRTTMYGLDVYHEVGVREEQAALLSSSSDPLAKLASSLLRHVAGATARSWGTPAAEPACIGDAGVICALAEPLALASVPMPVQVELEGRFTRGQTVVDRRRRRGESEIHGESDSSSWPVLDVATAVDGPLLARRFVETLLA